MSEKQTFEMPKTKKMKNSYFKKKTAYVLFYSEMYRKLKEQEEYKNKEIKDMSPILSKMWKDMPTAEKKVYIDLQIANDKIVDERRAQAIESGEDIHEYLEKPKRKKSQLNIGNAFMLWSADKRKSIPKGEKNPMKELGLEWRSMSDTEKQPWIDRHNKRKEEVIARIASKKESGGDSDDVSNAATESN